LQKKKSLNKDLSNKTKKKVLDSKEKFKVILVPGLLVKEHLAKKIGKIANKKDTLEQ
jgi:hypothetical protein